MADIGQALDKEWDQMARSEAADEAVRGWAEADPALGGLSCVQDALDRRLDPKAAPGVMAALARLAPTDRIAARTLLQALLPGLVCLTQDTGGGDADALDHLVALAWERIRTYPPGRPGSVPGNVLYDVRKRYRRERRPIRLRGGVPRAGEATPSAGELVLDRTLLGDVADANRRGVISDAAFALILRTRIGEEFLYEMAAEKSTTVAILNQQRYRAERRLEFAAYRSHRSEFWQWAWMSFATTVHRVPAIVRLPESAWPRRGRPLAPPPPSGCPALCRHTATTTARGRCPSRPWPRPGAHE